MTAMLRRLSNGVNFLDEGVNNLVTYLKNRPRDFFKVVHHSIFWQQVATSSRSVTASKALTNLYCVFNAFALVDLVDNLNNLKKSSIQEILGKSKVLVSDTVGSACDSLAWVTHIAGIVPISKVALSRAYMLSGLSLSYSSIQKIRYSCYFEPKYVGTLQKVFKVITHLSLLGIGLVTLYCEIFVAAYNPVVLVGLSSVAGISSFAKEYFIKDRGLKGLFFG